jgi:hypothetical protein
MVNKRDDEMFIICLSCHFGMGKLPFHGARGTPVDALYDYYAYNDKNLFCDASLVAFGVGTHIQGACGIQLIFCQVYYSYLLSL